MGYLALYRRYRPTTFDKVIGQDHIIQTLKNQIASDRIGHAYLFCGTRGTGKTTTAKIFAKAINCLSPVNGSPCGKCAACRALSDPSNLDVMEIDAASNNGVNEIREIRENVTYPPIDCRYKVYIIDEVHMLSSSAFNALLKTLEEPPKHAVFILATTEAHKMPQTILSRCMRFDFKLVSTEKIANLIKEVYDEIGKEYENEAIYAIASAGEGSIRDALSLADVAVSYGGGKLTYNDVLEVMGASDKSKIYSLVGEIFSGNADKVLSIVGELAFLGKSMGVLTRDILGVLREAMIAKNCKDFNSVLNLPKENAERVKALADSAVDKRILRCIEIFAEMENNLKFSVHPRVLFETAAVKAALPETDFDTVAIMARLSKLEEKLSGAVIPVEKPIAEERPTDSFAATEERANKKDLSDFSGLQIVGVVAKYLRQNKHLMLWSLVQGLNGEVEGNRFILYSASEGDREILSKSESIATIKEALSDFGDVEIIVKGEKKDLGERALEEDVDKIKKIFGDDIVLIKK